MTIKKQCDRLWIECIKARASYRSELSNIEGRKIGGTAILCSHHILGKATYRLRYSLDNGICLVNGKEHIFGVHNHNPAIAIEYYHRIIKTIGARRYKKILKLEQFRVKSDLTMVKIYLENKLKEYKCSTSIQAIPIQQS